MGGCENRWWRGRVLFCVILKRVEISSDIRYTRYADDITVSSNSKAIFSQTCLSIIERVLRSYGFEINKKKIHRMAPGTRQEITGLVVNSGKPTVSRRIRRILRAAVHNIVTGKVQPSQKDLNRIKGHLAFCMQVPEHKEWAMELMKKLGVNVDVKNKEKKMKPAINDHFQQLAEEGNISSVLRYPGDIAKVIIRSKNAPVDVKAKHVMMFLKSTCSKTEQGKAWLIRKLRLQPDVFIEFVRLIDKKYVYELTPEGMIIKEMWKHLSLRKKSTLLLVCPWVKSLVS